jgi:hypothetical protein
MNTNGHLPEGAKVVTLEQLRAANLKYIKAPMLSERLGSDVYVRIRAIRRAAYMQMIPPPPPGSEQWPQATPEMSPEEAQAALKARTTLFTDWLAAQPEADRLRRQRDLDDVTYKVFAAGVTEPAVTVEQAKDWGDDADVIAVEILRFSGMLPEEKVAEVVEVVPDLTQAPA